MTLDCGFQRFPFLLTILIIRKAKSQRGQGLVQGHTNLLYFRLSLTSVFIVFVTTTNESSKL